MRKRRDDSPEINMYSEPMVSINENGDRERTVIWSEGDGVLRNETTIINKKVPSAGILVLTAFVFTVLGALIASLVFMARFVDARSLVEKVTGRTAYSQSATSEREQITQQPALTSEAPTSADGNVVLPTPAPAQQERQTAAIASLSAIYDENVSGVVVVESYKSNGSHIGTGTGFFVTKDGYLLTNAHVVSGADQVRLTTYDKEVIKAEVIGADVSTDIAVLKAELDFEPNVLTLGDSSAVHTGDFVLAIGHPTGDELSFTATFGMVGATNRNVIIEGVRNEYIQIDAAINPGNSGGPLFDMNGRVIGITSAKTVVASFDEYGDPISAEGLGFTLPINSVMQTAQKIIDDGGIVRPGIGLSTIFIDSQTAEKYNIPVGGLVYTVTEGSPAHKAGLYADDIITEVDGVVVDSNETLGEYIRSKSIGDTVEIKYWREGKYDTCRLTIGDLNKLSGEVLDGAYGGSKYGIEG